MIPPRECNEIMRIRSMTGYGRGEATGEGRNWVAEVRKHCNDNKDKYSVKK